MAFIYICVLLRYNFQKSISLLQNINDYNRAKYRFILTNQIDRKENRIYMIDKTNKLIIDPQFPDGFNATGLTLNISKFIAKVQPDTQYSHAYLPYSAILGTDEIVWQFMNKGTADLEDKLEILENCYQKILKRLAKSDEKIEALWYSPNMPGYLIAKCDFENNTELIPNTRRHSF